MNYSVELSSQSKKFLKKLQKNISLRIINRLELLKENPFRYLEHFEGDYYKLRIRQYRSLIDIDFDRKILFVRVIDVRGRIYKRYN
jgi:mRNA interferase RelE/StbE